MRRKHSVANQFRSGQHPQQGPSPESSNRRRRDDVDARGRLLTTWSSFNSPTLLPAILSSLFNPSSFLNHLITKLSLSIVRPYLCVTTTIIIIIAETTPPPELPVPIDNKATTPTPIPVPTQ
ncbi:hypothetical protein BJY00DRAFT_292664 [Aspergillus carlsbadensis]|nr:hypothetical protein BJY00DRAFT_292664 [Aspergillus carlsbadensis]